MELQTPDSDSAAGSNDVLFFNKEFLVKTPGRVYVVIQVSQKKSAVNRKLDFKMEITDFVTIDADVTIWRFTKS